MIAIVTRTSNRPKYFNRCYESVLSQDIPCKHYVLYDNEDDMSYLGDKDVITHFVDRSVYEESYDETAPVSAVPPILSLHNLYFNEIYDSITEDWIYHLDDDNYLLPKAFTGVVKHLTNDVDLAILRINHFLGTLPRYTDCIMKRISVGGIDTGCFLVKKDLIKKVKWDGWKCGDYRVIKQCCELSKKSIWVKKVVMNMDEQGLGTKKDIEK